LSGLVKPRHGFFVTHCFAQSLWIWDGIFVIEDLAGVIEFIE